MGVIGASDGVARLGVARLASEAGPRRVTRDALTRDPACVLLFPFAMATKQRREPPYWLVGIEEICSCCGMRHSHAVEVRCVDCDQTYCPVCVVFVESDPLCSGCEAERRLA